VAGGPSQRPANSDAANNLSAQDRDPSQAYPPLLQDEEKQQNTSAITPALGPAPPTPSMPSFALGTDEPPPSPRTLGNVIPMGGSTNSSLLDQSVYKPGIDGGYGDLYQPVDLRENNENGKKAETKRKYEIAKSHPGALIVEQIQLHVPGMDSYMVADLVWRKSGTADLVIDEVKAGNGKLRPQQIEKLAEAVRTNNIYIKNEMAARDLKIQPRVTFAAQGILTQAYVSGGNSEAIIRQMGRRGILAIPEGPGGRPALRLLRGGRAM
jgi:hypothetical protein